MPDPINLQEIREHLAYWDHGKTDDPTVPMKHSWVLALIDATEAARDYAAQTDSSPHALDRLRDALARFE